jgi:hypothetical protein
MAISNDPHYIPNYDNRKNELDLFVEEDEDTDRVPSTLDPVLPRYLFQHLTKLDLTDCQLTSWTWQVRMVRHLPQLQVLILNDNPIRNITIPSNLGQDTPMDTLQEFQSLTELHLGGTAINSWIAIHPLNYFPQLRYIRLSSTPITNSMGTGEARAQIIARLSLVQQVNASIVTDKERNEAERRYIQSVARDMIYLANPNHDENYTQDMNGTLDKRRQELMQQHPLFDSLYTKHKEAMTTLGHSDGSNPSSSSTSSQYGMIHVTIRSMASNSITAEPIQKRLPLSIRIGRLKNICFKAFGLEIELQRLHYRCEVRSY